VTSTFLGLAIYVNKVPSLNLLYRYICGILLVGLFGRGFSLNQAIPDNPHSCTHPCLFHWSAQHLNRRDMLKFVFEDQQTEVVKKAILVRLIAGVHLGVLNFVIFTFKRTCQCIGEINAKAQILDAIFISSFDTMGGCKYELASDQCTGAEVLRLAYTQCSDSRMI
jgi:hypothetical protein